MPEPDVARGRLGAPPLWHLGVTVVANLALGLILRSTVGIAVNHGYVSDPEFVTAVGWTLSGVVVLTAAIANFCWQWLVITEHALHGFVAAVALSVPSLSLL